MLLRSSSTPVLGSLLCSDSPNHFDGGKSHSSSDSLKISFSQGGHPGFHPFSCNVSPIHNSIDRGSGAGPFGFRRAISDGNLEGLAAEAEDFQIPHPPRSSRRRCPVLQTIPSFSVRDSSRGEEESECGDSEQEEEESVGVNGLERHVTIGKDIGSVGGDFSFPKDLVRIEESEEIGFDNGIEALPLFLARGLGIEVGDPSSAFVGGGGAGGSDSPWVIMNGGGGEGSDLENFYKKVVEENPSNPLFLRNYAQFLYKIKGDYERAEEYYARAILAEPSDGEVLSQYAKLIWDHHRDEERASSYFEQAIQAASTDSNVLAAYASFLWETEEDEECACEDGGRLGSQDLTGLSFANRAVASASA